MTRPATAIDITDLFELRQIVEEAGGEPRVLRVDDEDVAILTPLQTDEERRRTKEEEDAAFFSSFGGWKGIVDGEKLKRELKEARGSDRPVVVFDE